MTKRRYLLKMVSKFNERRDRKSQSERFNDVADEYYARRLQ